MFSAGVVSMKLWAVNYVQLERPTE